MPAVRSTRRSSEGPGRVSRCGSTCRRRSATPASGRATRSGSSGPRARTDADAAYSYFGTERVGPLLVLLLVFVAPGGSWSPGGVASSRWWGSPSAALVIWNFMLPALLTGESGLLVGLAALGGDHVRGPLHDPRLLDAHQRRARRHPGRRRWSPRAIGVLAIGATRLTGIGDEPAGILSALVGELSFQGLFACAAIVAGLGVLNDVTITQASSVWEIRAAVPGDGPGPGLRQRHADRPRPHRVHDLHDRLRLRRHARSPCC